ncbi:MULTISPECIES: hypothetical protein [unclassified Roseofilum]|uniref:hypothetical protein n=1 Tax=unclassified Roseofilum TaxID=2620099 RepID=UPI000E7E1974|nr:MULTISPECIES: hypothetical protein [unclassified Roseofilum]MBP0006839.1 hypothetical protein [Roseofilum sp. Belize Diploria]MBP0035398.1 hypothetical protein [Roseofilum sp. Belize BBD 4]HBQ99780.1 hypothetical protein [Cyanobacteria bacterium UBA11691]
MTAEQTYPNAPDVSGDDYLVLGLATCFIKEDGEVYPVKVIEPIPSAALEALFKGIPTSYEMALGTTLGTVLIHQTPQKPTEFPEKPQFCDEFVERAIAAVRSYKVPSHQTAKAKIPIGTCHQDFNFSTERKRVLNMTNVVRTEDNVKQHEHTHKVL